MIQRAVGVFVLIVGAPLCCADDLTDAMLGIDPRDRLETGRGAALGEIYGPETGEPAAPEAAPELDQIPRGAPHGSYDSYYYYDEGGLKSSVSQPDASASTEGGEESSDTLSTPRLSLPQADTTLGRPDQREGVWYGDEPAP